jgi:hypothetical protein
MDLNKFVPPSPFSDFYLLALDHGLECIEDLAPIFLLLAYLSFSRVIYAFFHWREHSRTWLDP